MTHSWKLTLVEQYLHSAGEEELFEMLDALLPIIIESLPAEKRVAVLRSLIQEHLSALLTGVSREERRNLLEVIRPALEREFPLAEQPTHH